MLYRVHLAWVGFELTTLVVIDTDCIGSWNPTTIWSRPRQPLNLDDDLISGEIVSESEGSEEEDDDEEGETTQENEETYMNEQKAKLEQEKQSILSNQTMISEVSSLRICITWIYYLVGSVYGI